MSTGVDLSQFFETFFDEADELLADMEQQLLSLDPSQPDTDQLNAIFRAAHSIKGGAGTFGCFGMLAETTHLLENLLDLARLGELPLQTQIIDLFLETKDVLTDQVIAYRNGQEPDAEACQRICEQLRALAQEQKGGEGRARGLSQAPEAAAGPTVLPDADGKDSSAAPAQARPRALPGTHGQTPLSSTAQGLTVCVRLSRIDDKDAEALASEMALLGDVLHQERSGGQLAIWLSTSASTADISAVCCFIVNEDQVCVREEPLPVRESACVVQANGVPASGPPADAAQQEETPAASPNPAVQQTDAGTKSKDPGKTASSSTLRVGVEKVDQIINLVGELVITQAMLLQTSSMLDPAQHGRLLNGIEQLERNARDLQDAVMSIRMVPMDYVFSRFPRVVRESAAKLGKDIRLTTQGQATELDKSLIERIIDPLTHLVRNSIDHGIEPPETRRAAGKPVQGNLLLSAQHHGGHIIIEVTDDGAGLSRERILRKARSLGMQVGDSTPDEELWQLIFSPGFSTAEQVTEISGRGVGMDVVRRNIQGMGGHIQLSSQAGRGTTTRIILPLTLAILDGMSVGVGGETFILPLSHVTESIQPLPDQIRQISDTESMLFVRGEYLPLVALRDVFSVAQAQADVTRSIVVILQAEDTRFALQVDRLIGQHQVVVKNLEANYRKVPGVSAATILGDGSVALIVDVFALMQLSRDKVVY